jgi:hypothetical protein
MEHNKYCLTVCTNQSNIQIPQNAIQISNDIFIEVGNDNSKICLEPQKTPNRIALRKKSRAGGIILLDFKYNPKLWH